MTRVDITYHFWNAYIELGAIFIGPLGVTVFFLFLMLVTWIFNKYIFWFPKLASKLIVWWGLGAVGDPFLIAVVDISTRYNIGDVFKLSNYYQKADGSGFAGIIIILIVYGFLFMLNIFIFYFYMIFHHMDGRLQDLYLRILGNAKIFFIPGDNEISLKHILWAYHSSIQNSFRIVVNKAITVSPKGIKKPLSVMQISEYDTKTTINHKRSFIRDEIGCIKELTESEISHQSALYYDKLD